MRYFIWFAYDGAKYHGWQIQPNANTVQAELQTALSTILRQPIEVVGAGRTDAGVHAKVMAAHFDVKGMIDVKQTAYKLNRLLPKDISVNKVELVDDELHARFSARKRTYHYYIHKSKNPFLRNYSCEINYPLDFEEMNKAAKLLLECKDFAAFCKSHTDVATTLCDVTEAEWIKKYPRADEWYFRISANRFLRNMVRAVVGTLIEVGKGRMSIAQFNAVLQQKSRQQAGESMPAHALFLEELEY